MFPSSSPSTLLHKPLVPPSAFSSESSRDTSSPLLSLILGSQQVLTGTTAVAQALHFHSAECKEAGVSPEQETPKLFWPSPACTPGESLLPQQLQSPAKATAKTRDSPCWVAIPSLYHTPCSLEDDKQAPKQAVKSFRAHRPHLEEYNLALSLP